MRRVFLIISLLCLMPFAMMAQTPVVCPDQLCDDYAYGFVINDTDGSGSYVRFEIGSPSTTLETLKTYDGMWITAAEMVPYNSTKDFVYAYATTNGTDGTFCKVDPVTGDLTVIASGVEPMTELAYDPTTKTMYGLSLGVLYSINLEDGSREMINEMQTGSNNWVALAINNDGVMYAVTNTFSNVQAELYRILHGEGYWNSTLVATVPYKTQYAQSMAFDRDNGDLYWWQTSQAGSNLLKVDPEAGTCTVLWGNNAYHLTGLMFHNNPEMFNITYETVQHGVLAGPAQAAENDVVTVTPTFEPGFGMGTITWTANGEEHTITGEAPFQFTMPDADVTVSAEFVQTGVNTVFIGTDYYGYFDDIVTVAVEMTNENLVAGAQMDINLGANLTFQEGSLTLGDRAEGEGWSITGSLYGNILRVTVFNTGLSYFTGNEGILFTFQVKCARVVSNNTLAITGLIAGTPDAFNLAMLSADGALEIKDVTMVQPTSIVVCNNTLTEPIAFSTEIAETEGEMTYAWTNDNAEIGLAAEGTGDIAAFTALNAGMAPVVANLTVTPTLMHNGNPCVGSTLNFTITVNPTGVVNPVESIEVHNGDVIPEIAFTSPNEGGETTYAWTNDNPEIGLAAEGTGNIASFTAVNEQVSVVSTANITVVPTFTNAEVSCEGEPINFTITVNPTKHYITVLDPLDGELATNPAEIGVWQEPVTVLPTPDPGFSMGTITWTANGEENTITGEAPYEFIMPDYDVTVSAVYEQTGVNTVFIGTDYYGYFDDIVTVAVEMTNENLVAGLQLDIDLGENLTFQEGTLALADRTEGENWNITGSMDGNVLKVTLFNTETTAIAGNEGAVFTFQVKCARVVSNNTLAISGLIAGTPDATNLNMLSTDGALEIKDVVMNQPENLVVCNNALTEPIAFSTEIAETEGEITYAWTNDNAEIGLAAEGTGDIAAFTALNAGTAPVVANLTVTPTLMHNGNPCVGSTLEFTITVNPTPVVEAVENQVVCNGAEVSAITFATTATGGEVTYAWTNDNAEIGLAAEGTGDIAAFTAINAGTAPVVATVTVTPTFDGACVGEPISFTITVNPTPVVEVVENQMVCNGAEVSAITFTTTATGGEVTYAWTNDNPAIGLAAEGNGDIAAFMATNTETAAIVANIAVTPTFDGACVGEPMTFTITVLPQPVMDEVADIVTCDNSNVAVNFATPITDGTVTYAWTNDNPAIGLEAEGNGNISFLALNSTPDAVVANIEVIPTYTMGEVSCEGEAIAFVITVYPATTVDPVENQTVYSRESTEAIFFSAPVNDYDQKVIFNWTNDNPAIGLAESGTGNIPSFITAPCSTEQVAHITVSPIYNGEEHSCEGNSTSFTITVLPTFLVVINDGITNGTLYDNARVAVNGDHYAPAGEEITLTATPAEDYFLDFVTVTALDNNSIVVPFTAEYQFVMPAFDVLCNANFIDANNLSIQPGILDLGYRPINAWMYSKFFDVNNISEAAFDVTEIDFTNYEFMELDEIELPFTIEAGESVQIGVNTNYKNVAPGLYNATMALKGIQNRKAYLREMVATAYTPVEPDVWELATNVTTFPFVSTQETEGTLYNVYQLPGETPDGYDGVYKIVVDRDVILDAAVTAGNDPKVALYDAGFKGVGGPHTNNYHGAAEELFNEAILGTGTATSTAMPYNTYYKYSLCQMLFTAEELHAAGLNAGKLNAIEFASNSTNGFTRSNLSVWMAPTSLNVLATPSITVAGMNKVFQGAMTQVPGWNRFTFNGEQAFVWDGTSNILVTVLNDEGAWSSPQTAWLCTAPGFNAAMYANTDNASYTPETNTYSMTIGTNRPNIHFIGESTMTEGIAMTGEPIVGLGLYPGTYYVVASSTSEDSYTVEINVQDMPLPEAPVAIYPAHEAQGIPTPVTLEYELGQYTHEYQILLGTSYTSQEVVLDWTDQLSNTFDAGQLLHNKVYFWRINERNSSGVTEGPLWAFTTVLNEPLNLTVVDDELYEGENAVFNWDTPADRTLRGYNLYKDGVKVNETMITGNTYTLSGLTYNMDGYAFNLTAIYDEGESEFSNTVNVLVSGYGIVSGHVYEQDGTTGIAGATVTIIGFDEFDELVDFEFITDAQGAYSGNVLAGYFFGMAEKEGYQTAGDNVGIEVEYQGTISNYDFILTETYNAVSRVVAEEIDDNLVHVYWGWDLIEDFESGNLESYDWVNDTQYPWVITTTDPYEGSYCIKSTNEGVASSTSSIEITMMASADGMMSFYAKASSESSYDKGLFFIDNVQKTTMSGATGWAMKEYAISAGLHTFRWTYSKDSSVNNNDDCFYIDYINFWYAAPPAPEGQILVDFESGMPAGWTTIDADGDGYNWGLISDYYPSDGGYNSTDGAYSFSWSASTGGIEPDNYLVSPQIELGGSIGFWANNHYSSYPEKVGVAISTTGNTNAADFTTIWSTTVDAKSYTPPTMPREEDNAKVGNWIHYTVDLSAYSGMGYIAIRHFDVYNMWGLLIDDIAIDQPRERAFTDYNVYRQNLSTGQAPQLLTSGITEEEYDDATWGSAAAGVYQWGVSANYAGNRGESEITWSNKIDKNMTTNVTVHVSTNSGDPVDGAVVTLTNTSEPALGITYNTTLDETGTYAWDNFRKGTYDVAITLAGFQPLSTTATVWEPTTLSYVLTELIESVEELYVSTTGWAMFGEIPSGNGGTEPFSVDFEEGLPEGWTILDANNDTYTWTLTSDIPSTWTYYSGMDLTWYQSGTNAICSGSYINGVGAITPDDYLITPQVTPAFGTTFSFWVAAADANYPAEHFGVFVSTTGTNPSDFTSVQEWNLTAKSSGTNGGRASRDGNGAKLGNWHNFSVDLSAYAGQNIYIAVRHFNCNDQYIMVLDDVEFGANRQVEYYNVKLDGILEGTTVLPFFQHNVENLVEGETYTTSVQRVYTTGESEWVDFDWVYTACDNYAGLLSDPTAHWSGEDVVLNWTLPTGGGDTPTPPDPPTGDATIVLNVPNDIWGDGSGYQMLLDADATMFTQLDAVSYFNEIGSFSEFEYTIPENADYGVNPTNIVIQNSVTITIPAGVYDYAIINPDKVSTIWFVGSQGNTESKGDDMVYEANKTYTYTIIGGSTGDGINLTVTNNGKGNRSVSYDFEGSLQGWTTLDADANTTMNWYHSSDSYNQSGYDYTGKGHNGSDGFAVSQSYIDYQGAYTADNYLVSPQMFALQNGSSITFWADNANDSYPDSFGVYVATVANPTPSDFTMVWDGNAKGAAEKAAVRHDASRYNNWRQHTVDLSSHAGETVWIAFRHHDYDMYEIWIDDVTIDAEGGDVPPVDPDDPTPAADVLGVQIFRDGEWIAQVPAPAMTYTDLAPESASEYTFRVYYDGDTEDFMYYRMSCPQNCGVDEDPCKAPENLVGSYVWNTPNEFGALINWTYGEFGIWLNYGDAGVNSMVGTGSTGNPFYWGNMFPAETIAPYGNAALTDVSFIAYNSDQTPAVYTINIYIGGEESPTTLVHTQDYNFDGVFTGSYTNVTLTTPVTLDPTQSLWITLYNDDIKYPAVFSTTGDTDPRGRLISEDGILWEDVAPYVPSVKSWSLLGYITNAVNGGETVALAPNHSNSNNSRNFSTIEFTDVKPEFDFHSGNRIANSFNVYRDGALIANVDANETGIYEYFDQVAIGNYEYQVTALYDECESGFALTPDGSMDYVEVSVTDVNEASSTTKLYPNPTNGNVMIEASGMTHITVVNTLGQVLYDANVRGDMYELSLGQYTAGLYLVRIASENGVTVKRVTLVK